MRGRPRDHERRASRVRRGGLVAAGTALAIHLTGVTTWAQAPGSIPNDDGGWMQWIIGGAIMIIVCATAFIKSKRSHLT